MTAHERSEQSPSTVQDRQEEDATIARITGTDTDPNAKLVAEHEQLNARGIDVFDHFSDRGFPGVGGEGELSPETRAIYERTFETWKAFMETQSRHPACPNEHHVRAFLDHEHHKKGNAPKTVKEKTRQIQKVYHHLQQASMFNQTAQYDPFAIALNGYTFSPDSQSKDHYHIPHDTLSDILRDTTHIRDRALLLSGFKLFARAGEVVNIRFEDIALNHPELQDYYPELGDSIRQFEDQTPGVEPGAYSNTIIIPSSRKGNKSQRDRLLPLDGELRHALIQYLLLRPDTGHDSWVFLSASNNVKLDSDAVNNVWKNVFREQHGYDETERYKGVTSHFGRHWATTYWNRKVNEMPHIANVDIKYMRGDILTAEGTDASDAINVYLHTHYEDIADTYREYVPTFL